MNPNSQHQRWSFWSYTVYPGAPASVPVHFTEMRLNCMRFGRLLFGSASCMRIVHTKLYWEVSVLSEGHPVHDPQYVEWMHEQWRQFFNKRFGNQCEVRVHARLEAGDRQDGRPPDQLILLPELKDG